LFDGEKRNKTRRNGTERKKEYAGREKENTTDEVWEYGSIRVFNM
jgi:hypothetical protein